MHADRLIAELARHPGALVTRAELLDAGIGRGAIAHRLRTGRLRRIHPALYAVGGAAALDAAGRGHAAVLACGAGAVLSHGSAAALWRLLPDGPGPPEVLRSGAHRDGPEGVRLRTTAWLPPDQRSVHRGVPLTSPARTLLDLAATGTAGRLERAVHEALAARLTTTKALRRLVATGRPGSAVLRSTLQEAPGFTRSEAERRFVALVDRAELPRPLLNHRVAGVEVDAFWPAARLIVEVDGYAAHGGRTSFERDRRRDQHLAANGLLVVRVTWRDLVDRREALSARLGAVLARTAPTTALPSSP